MIFTDRKIYFSRHEELNDPFEYSYTWTTDSPLAIKLPFWNKLDNHYRSTLAGKTELQQEASILEWEKDMVPPSGPKIIGSDKIGIFCCSKTTHNLPVWSMYADRHRGICLTFESDNDEVLKKLKPITYSDAPGEFSLYRGINHADVFTKKYSQWNFEEEIRAFHDPGQYTFDSRALKSIIFGLTAWLKKENRDKVNELIALAKNNFPNAKIQRALRDKDDYKLRLQDI
jgi:hypothetical protein